MLQLNLLEKENTYVQTTMFEQDYIHRTSGSVTSRYDVALTELIANAWDAGASKVEITIPEEEGNEIIIEDDGTGMTEEEFNKRWMTLNYNRLTHQGINAEFPPSRNGMKRKAYGRNGIGRHSMLCFSDAYKIETWKNGECFKCNIVIDSGNNPYKILNPQKFAKDGNGTKLSTIVAKNLPNISIIGEILSARYLYDPEFIVSINGKVIELSDHKGLIKKEQLKINDDITLTMYIIDSYVTAKKSLYHGVAFWVGNRLVGKPSWQVGENYIKDGRTQVAKRYTIISKSDDLINYVEADWTGFKDDKIMKIVYDKVAQYVSKELKELNREKIEETKLEIVRQRIDEIEDLNVTSQNEIATFVDELIEKQPEIDGEEMETILDTMINIQKSRCGEALLKKLSSLSEDDINSLNEILENWDVRDIANTLDIIDNRILVIEAIERLCNEKTTDELHTLHPLVAQARWLFGPEYDSEYYTYNQSLSTIVRDVLKNNNYKETLDIPRKRPDLIFFDMSTVSSCCIEDMNDNALMQYDKILIIELKKGGHEIGKDEMSQANEYVEALSFSGNFTNKPEINAFVVGSTVYSKMSSERNLAEINSKVIACTYNQLIATARRRLFKLKDYLADRYEKMSTENIVTKVLSEPKQTNIKYS